METWENSKNGRGQRKAHPRIANKIAATQPKPEKKTKPSISQKTVEQLREKLKKLGPRIQGESSWIWKSWEKMVSKLPIISGAESARKIIKENCYKPRLINGLPTGNHRLFRRTVVPKHQSSCNRD